MAAKLRMTFSLPGWALSETKIVRGGQTVQQVIDFIAEQTGADVDQVSLNGSFLTPDDSFDDFYDSVNQVFVFSKGSALSGSPPPEPSPSSPISLYTRNFQGMRTIRVLGEGAFGSVALVEDSSTGEKIALKSFRPPPTPGQSISAVFFREIESLIALSHPCVLRIIGYSLATQHSPAQIGTEFVSGGSLRDVLGSLDDTQKAIVAIGIVIGMKFIHSRGIIHRDLKPENILLDERGYVKIGDLGSSRFCDLGLTMTNQVGTPLYMAPETYEDAEYTFSVDVYSFSLILYELLVGERVFPSTIASGDLMRRVLSGVRPKLPKSMRSTVKDIISRGWSVKPGKRRMFDKIFDLLDGIHFKLTSRVDVQKVAAFVTFVDNQMATVPRMQLLEQQSEMDSLRKRLEQQQSKNRTLQDQLLEQQKEKEGFREQLNQQQNENRSLQDRLLQRQRENRELQSHVEKIRSKLVATQEEAERIRREVVDLHNQLKRRAPARTRRLSEFFCQLSDFEVTIKTFAKGSFSSTRVALDRRTGEAVVVAHWGTWRNNVQVMKQFYREVDILTLISHPTLIAFRGFIPVQSGAGEGPAIVTEFMSGGSLQTLIDAERRGMVLDRWDDTQKLICLYGIATGMMILHQHRIMHRNLKPSNVLLTNDLEPKVSDFSRSKFLEFDEDSGLEEEFGYGISPYIAPELLLDEDCGLSVDVYAYGIIVYETISGLKPYHNRDWPNFFVFAKNIYDGLRPSIPCTLPRCWADLMESCWRMPPDNRLTFGKIVNSLESPEFTGGVSNARFLRYMQEVARAELFVRPPQ
jgi:serine/threonine protein kinase